MGKKVLIGVLAAGVLLAGSVVPGFAGGGHGWRGGVVFVGPRLFVPPPVVFAPPVYYYPRPWVHAAPAAVVVAPPPVPPVYTQGPQAWYYCQDPAGYYPSVPQCPGGWVQVPAQSQ